MSKLDDAQQKLRFADYLLQRDSPELMAGAMKHVLQAANLAVAVLLCMDEKSSVSPILIRKKLAESTNPQEKEFSTYFLELWKMTLSPGLTRQDIVNAYKRVSLFLNYVKGVRAGI